MKKVFTSLHRSSRITFVAGWLIIAAVFAASTVLYIGAGQFFDYYSAVDFSEKLLASARPISVAVCASSVGIEYYFKKKKHSSD